MSPVPGPDKPDIPLAFPVRSDVAALFSSLDPNSPEAVTRLCDLLFDLNPAHRRWAADMLSQMGHRHRMGGAVAGRPAQASERRHPAEGRGGPQLLRHARRTGAGCPPHGPARQGRSRAALVGPGAGRDRSAGPFGARGTVATALQLRGRQDSGSRFCRGPPHRRGRRRHGDHHESRVRAPASTASSSAIDPACSASPFRRTADSPSPAAASRPAPARLISAFASGTWRAGVNERASRDTPTASLPLRLCRTVKRLRERQL